MSLPTVPDSVQESLRRVGRGALGPIGAGAVGPVGAAAVSGRVRERVGETFEAVRSTGALGVGGEFLAGLNIDGSIRDVANAGFDRLRAAAITIGLFQIGLLLTVVGLLIVFRSQIGSVVGVNPVTRARRAVRDAARNAAS